MILPKGGGVATTLLGSTRITYCSLFALSVLSAGSKCSSAWSTWASPSHNFPSTATTRMSSTTTTCPTSTITVAQVPCLSDNYGYLIHDSSTGSTAAIDTPEAKPYQDELAKRGWKLTHILNTHHHYDHTGANMELKTGGVQIVGPASEKPKIPGIDVAVSQDDEITFGSSKAKIIDVGGHTKGHIAYYFPNENLVFVGDALFALGCGKMFEGTAPQFWDSLQRLRSLPDETMVYCAHEYTTSNAKFAVSVEPGNAELMARYEDIKKKRANNEPTVPSLLGLEKKTNPFLRSDISEEIRKNCGVVAGDSDATAFGKVRSAKDNFRG